MRRRESALAMVKPDMTPMIDCVFQLMIFFMLTLKFVQAEGTFDINMPADGIPGGFPTEDIKVRLVADADGNLVSLKIGQRHLGNDDRAFERLNSEILRAIGGTPGGPASKDTEVEIDADHKLHYEYVIKAMTACTGRFDQRTQQAIRYIEKIKLAPPRR